MSCGLGVLGRRKKFNRRVNFVLEHYPEKEIPILGDFQGLTRQCQGRPDLALVIVLFRAGVWTRDIQKSLLANMSITAAMLCLHPGL